MKPKMLFLMAALAMGTASTALAQRPYKRTVQAYQTDRKIDRTLDQRDRQITQVNRRTDHKLYKTQQKANRKRYKARQKADRMYYK